MPAPYHIYYKQVDTSQQLIGGSSQFLYSYSTYAKGSFSTYGHLFIFNLFVQCMQLVVNVCLSVLL